MKKKEEESTQGEYETRRTESGLTVVTQAKDPRDLRARAHTREGGARSSVSVEESGATMEPKGECGSCGDLIWGRVDGRRPVGTGWMWRYRGERVCSIRCMVKASLNAQVL